MNEQVKQIKAEIERRLADNKKEIERAVHKHLEEYFEGYEDALSMLSDFINFFPEEQRISIVDFKASDWYVSKVDDKIHKIAIDNTEPSSPIDFEKELYKAFGQVKDFTLGMQIAKRFYNIGRNSQ